MSVRINVHNSTSLTNFSDTTAAVYLALYLPRHLVFEGILINYAICTLLLYFTVYVYVLLTADSHAAQIIG